MITDELTDPTGDVAKILENVHVLTSEVREGKGTLGALITRDDLYQKTSGVLDTTQETVDNLKVVSSNTREASTRFDGIIEEAGSSVRKFGEFSDEARGAAAELSEMIGSGQQMAEEGKIVMSNLRSASEDIKEATPKIGPLIESADEGVGEAREAIDAVRRSWLIRGYLEPATPGVPIAVSGRDIAQPEVP